MPASINMSYTPVENSQRIRDHYVFYLISVRAAQCAKNSEFDCSKELWGIFSQVWLCPIATCVVYGPFKWFELSEVSLCFHAVLCAPIYICMCGLSCLYYTTRKRGFLLKFLPIHFLKKQVKQWCTGQSMVKSCLCSTRQLNVVCWKLPVPYYVVKWVQKWKPDDPEHCSLVLPLTLCICQGCFPWAMTCVFLAR